MNRVPEKGSAATAFNTTSGHGNSPHAFLITQRKEPMTAPSSTLPVLSVKNGCKAVHHNDASLMCMFMQLITMTGMIVVVLTVVSRMIMPMGLCYLIM